MTSQEIKKISELAPYAFNVCIMVVITNLTAIKTSRNGNPFFTFVATDASGEIEGVCFEPRQHGKLQNGESYKLTRFGVRSSKFTKKSHIVMEKVTVIEKIKPLSINVKTKFYTVDDIVKFGENGQFVDFKGQLLEKPTITHGTTPEKKTILRVRVTDMEHLMAITMTAWNDNVFRDDVREGRNFTLLSGKILVWEEGKSLSIISQSILSFAKTG